MKKLLCALLCLSSLIGGLAQAAVPSAIIAWTAPTADSNGNPLTGPITYNVYQATTCSGTFTRIQSALTVTTATVTAGLTAGTTQCWVVTATVNSIESPWSNTASAAIGFPTPNAPTQITVVIH